MANIHGQTLTFKPELEEVLKMLNRNRGKWVLARSKKKLAKARAYGTRTDATRYARGKSANFVPTREIFFVRYNIEKK